MLTREKIKYIKSTKLKAICYIYNLHYKLARRRSVIRSFFPVNRNICWIIYNSISLKPSTKLLIKKMKLAIMFYLLTILCKFRLSLGEECNSPWSMELTLCEDYMKLAQSETRAISLSLLSEYMKTVAKLENMLSNLRANNHVLDRKMKMELNKTGDIIDMLIRQGRNVGHCLDASTEALIRILEDGQLSILECVVVTTEFFVTVSKDIVKASYLGKQLRQDLKNMSQICFVNSTSNENLTSINIEFANAECRMVEFKQKYQTNSYLPIETLEEMMLKTNECIKEQDRTISKKVLDVASHTVNCISTT